MYHFFTTSMNIADLLTNKLTALDKAVTTVSEQFLCSNHNATDMQLIPLELVNLIVTVYKKQEKHSSMKEFQPLNLLVVIRKMKLYV